MVQPTTSPEALALQKRFSEAVLGRPADSRQISVALRTRLIAVARAADADAV